MGPRTFSRGIPVYAHAISQCPHRLFLISASLLPQAYCYQVYLPGRRASSVHRSVATSFIYHVVEFHWNKRYCNSGPCRGHLYTATLLQYVSIWSRTWNDYLREDQTRLSAMQAVIHIIKSFSSPLLSPPPYVLYSPSLSRAYIYRIGSNQRSRNSEYFLDLINYRG